MAGRTKKLQNVVDLVRANVPKKGVRGRRIRMASDADIESAVISTLRCPHNSVNQSALAKSAEEEYGRAFGVPSVLMMVILRIVVEVIFWLMSSGSDEQKQTIEEARSTFKDEE